MAQTAAPAAHRPSVEVGEGLGLEKDVFDVRRFAEFVASDVLLDLGGLLLLALPTFLVSTGLPEAFAVLLAGLQALFVVIALAMASKHIAKIRDYFPTAVEKGALGEDALAIDGNGSLYDGTSTALTPTPGA